MSKEYCKLRTRSFLLLPIISFSSTFASVLVAVNEIKAAFIYCFSFMGKFGFGVGKTISIILMILECKNFTLQCTWTLLLSSNHSQYQIAI